MAYFCMKKVVLLLLAFLILVSMYNVLADCQYKTTNITNKTVYRYYNHNGEEIFNNTPIYVTSIDNSNPYYQLNIKNFANVEIIGNISYTSDGKREERSIDLKSSETAGLTGNGDVDASSIIFKLLIEQDIEEINETHKVCKQCFGNDCLNDGDACNPLDDNVKCGSGICNIAGICGHKKVVPCPDGLRNCNSEICLNDSTKEVGQAYKCYWECKSDKYENGTCLKSSGTIKKEKEEKIKQIILYFALVLLVIGVAVVLMIRTIKGKIGEGIIGDAKEQGKEIIQKATKKAKALIKKQQEKLEQLNTELENKEQQKINIEKELNSLKDEKEDAKKLRIKLIAINNDIERLTEEQTTKTNELKTEKEKLTKERLTPFLNKQGRRVYIDENGYEVLERTGTLFHRWWFEHNHNTKIKTGYEIHHKDFTKRNNDIDNLEELTPEEHKQKHKYRYLK